MSEQNDDGKTNVLPDLDKLLQGMPVPQGASGTGSLLGKKEVLLVIGDKIERIMLAENMHCLLGRFSQTKPSAEAVDLNPYDAQEHGVSRIHALPVEADDQGLANAYGRPGEHIHEVDQAFAVEQHDPSVGADQVIAPERHHDQEH